MANLTSSDSVLEKLSGINNKLTELYSLIDDVKTLRQGINAVYIDLENSLKQFNHLNEESENKLKEIKNSSDIFSKLISELNYRKNELNAEVSNILDNYKEQEEKLNKILSVLNLENNKYESLKKQLEESCSTLDRNIEEKLTNFESQLEKTSNSFIPLVEKKVDDVLNTLSSKLNNFASLIKQDLLKFKNEVENKINKKLEYIEQVLSQKIDNRLDKINEEQANFLERQNRLIQQQKTLIDDLTSQIDSLQRIYEKDKREKQEAINLLDEYIKDKIKPKIDEYEIKIKQTEIKTGKLEQLAQREPRWGGWK